MGYQLNIVFLNIVPYSNYQKSCFVNYKRSMYLNSKLQQKTQQQQYMRSNFLQRIQILTVHVSFCSQWRNRRYINRGRAYEAAYVIIVAGKKIQFGVLAFLEVQEVNLQGSLKIIMINIVYFLCGVSLFCIKVRNFTL